MLETEVDEAPEGDYEMAKLIQEKIVKVALSRKLQIFYNFGDIS